MCSDLHIYSKGEYMFVKSQMHAPQPRHERNKHTLQNWHHVALACKGNKTHAKATLAVYTCVMHYVWKVPHTRQQSAQ